MATPRKTIPAENPLVKELPPEPEPKPETSDEVKFEIEISPYVVNGETFFKWEIVGHNFREYAGDWTGIFDTGYSDGKAAEFGATLRVGRIRKAVEQKLNAPEAYRITL